jgi:hypothetical protein
MKIQLNTNLIPIFSGTYESVWDIVDCDDNGNELYTVYDHNELMKGICKAYQDNADYIVSELNIPWIKKIKFTASYSPREYNFSTDTLDFDITVSKKDLYKALEELKGSLDFEKYLRDNFTSYDGFMSFTPNSYQDLYNEILTQGREFEQSIGAIIRYLVDSEKFIGGGDYYNTIESSIHESWNGNGYGGTSYHVECPDCYEKLEYPYTHTCK